MVSSWQTLRLDDASQRSTLLQLTPDYWVATRAYDLAQAEIAQRHRNEREQAQLYDKLVGGKRGRGAR